MNKEIERSFISSKAIEANNYEHPEGTLITAFHKPAGEANKFVRFGYGPQTIFNHTRGKLSGSMNTYPINANKQEDNQQRKNDN